MIAAPTPTASVSVPSAVSWRVGSNFGSWHLVASDDRTKCGVQITATRKTVLPLRDARGHVCRSCLAACRRELVEAQS